MIIRECRNSDVNCGLLDCLRALAPCPDVNHAAFFLAVRDRRGVRTIVAVEDDRVVGTVSLFFEPKLLRGGCWAGHVEDVAVRPDCQKRGIGRALVDHALQLCREKGCYKVVLDCDPAVAPFYAGAGFRDNGTCMRVDL